uniref:Uncharacterized protein n=1 Tax=Brassica oleracea var. oleracea TaxID=109376 RepID=A0A0D3CT21_BRAOL
MRILITKTFSFIPIITDTHTFCYFNNLLSLRHLMLYLLCHNQNCRPNLIF